MNELSKFVSNHDNAAHEAWRIGRVPTALSEDKKSSITELLDRKQARTALIAGEANNLPSVSALLTEKVLDRPELYTREPIPSVELTTAVGELKYTRKTGEAIINGDPKRVSSRRRPVWERLIDSPGETVTPRELQEVYDPKGHEAGLDTSNIKVVVFYLRKDLDDPKGELIRSDRDLGYTIAVPETSFEEAWINQIVDNKTIDYNPQNRRLRINGGDPIKLSPRLDAVWKKFISDPEKNFTLEELGDGNASAAKFAVLRLRRIIGKDGITRSSRSGFRLAVE